MSTEHGPISKNAMKIGLSLSLFLLVCTFFIYQNEVNHRVNLIQLEQRALIEESRQIIRARLNTPPRDVLYLANKNSIKEFIESNSDSSLQVLIRSLEKFMSTRVGLYSQLRYINEAGQEVVRIDSDHSGVRVSEKNKLQYKGDRYYFKQGKLLDHRTLYVSPMDLNIENDQVEIPYKPTLRFVSRVYDQNGAASGVIVLNYLGQALIDRIKGLIRNKNHSDLWLLNGDGYWMSHPAKPNEWGFMFPEKNNLKLPAIDAKLWAHLLKNSKSKAESFSLNGAIYSGVRLTSEEALSNVRFSISANTKIDWHVVISVAKDAMSEVTRPLKLGYFGLCGILICIVLLVCYWGGRIDYRRKEIEEKLRIEQGRFDIAIRAAEVGIWDWQDTASSYVYWNANFYELLGYKNKEFDVNFDVFIDFLHPDDRTPVGDAVQSHLEKATIYDINYRLRKKDGSYSWFRAKGKATRDKDGKPLQMAGSVINIDAQIQAEQDTVYAKERFRLAVEGVSVGVWDWFNINESQEFWSPQFYKLLGYENGEIEATVENFTQLLHPDDQERTFAAVKAHLEKNTPFDIEYRLRLKQGAYRWFRGTGSVSRNKDAKPERMVGGIEDIHEKKMAQAKMQEYTAKLAESNKDLEQFVFAASHDLQEPLRTISSYLRLIERRYQSNLEPEALEFFDIVKDSCQRMKRLIADLLAYARVAKTEQAFKPINLNTMLEVLAQQYQAQNPHISIKLGMQADCFIDGVESFIERLLANVISNAIKYRHIERDLVIDISLESQGENVIIYIKDNGIGINSDYFDKIFAIFQRLHSMDEYEGTGVGLAICKRIVQIHHGDISVNSQLGLGSEFRIQLHK